MSVVAEAMVTHEALMQACPEILRPILELHQPVPDDVLGVLSCAGCGTGDYAFYEADFPCRTYQLASTLFLH
jgi:hypothetical protein